MGNRETAVSRRWLRVVLTLGGILAAWFFLRWEVIGAWPIFVFVGLLIDIGLSAVFLVTALAAVAYYAVKAYKLGWAAGRHVATVAVFTIAVLAFPYTEVVLNADFIYYRADREKVVAMVKAGDPALKAEAVRDFGNLTLQKIELPPEYIRLSKGGGEIIVQRRGTEYKILFYTFRGVLDNFSGFVYVSDGSGLHNDDFRGDFKQAERMGSNWFFGASK